MPKFLVKQSFRITPEDMKSYPQRAQAIREMTPTGQIKPSSHPNWIVAGAFYIAHDVIEVMPVEAAELFVVAPKGALEAING